MIQPILSKIKPNMQEVIDKLKEDFMTVRTGKASGALVENISVSYYGAQTPLKNMANISTPDAFLIIVQPWDANSLGDIEAALRNVDLGFGLTNDGRVVRITMPPLTEERRIEFIKLIHQKAEAARITLRGLRQTAWEEVQKEKKSGEITEDDLYQGEKDLNKLIDDFNDTIREMVEAKEKELKTV